MATDLKGGILGHVIIIPNFVHKVASSTCGKMAIVTVKTYLLSQYRRNQSNECTIVDFNTIVRRLRRGLAPLSILKEIRSVKVLGFFDAAHRYIKACVCQRLTNVNACVEALELSRSNRNARLTSCLKSFPCLKSLELAAGITNPKGRTRGFEENKLLLLAVLAELKRRLESTDGSS